MKKIHFLFVLVTFLAACSGEDVDIANIFKQEMGTASTDASGKFTKPGKLTNITSTSVTIDIERQSAESQEFIVIVPADKWKILSNSTVYYTDCIIAPIPQKTDTQITVSGLTPNTLYYCCQMTGVNYRSQYEGFYTVSSYSDAVNDRFVLFKTTEIAVTTGDVISCTSNSATIAVNPLGKNDYLYYNKYKVNVTSSSYSKNISSTDKSVTLTNLDANTTYYYCQVNTMYGTVYGEIKQFTTKAPELKIISVKKLGLHHVIFKVSSGCTGLCYSRTNTTPTTNDYTWSVSSGERTVENFVANQEYYVRPYVNNSSTGYNSIYGDVMTVKTDATIDKYANAVDLGVSVKWADRSLLALSPSDNSTYTFYYPFESSSSQNDNATYHWGGKWRVPTKAEVEELQQLPMLTTKQNGVEGLLVKGKVGTAYANNSIFIPNSNYWTSTQKEGTTSYWYYFCPGTDMISTSYTSNSRYIFAVQDK